MHLRAFSIEKKVVANINYSSFNLCPIAAELLGQFQYQIGKILGLTDNTVSNGTIFNSNNVSTITFRLNYSYLRGKKSE